MTSQLRPPDRNHPLEGLPFGAAGHDHGAGGPLGRTPRSAQPSIYSAMVGTTSMSMSSNAPTSAAPSRPTGLAGRLGLTAASILTRPTAADSPAVPPAVAAPVAAAPAQIQPSIADRGWLERRSVQLDPRRHPSVSGSSAVSAVLRAAGPSTETAVAGRILPHAVTNATLPLALTTTVGRSTSSDAERVATFMIATQLRQLKPRSLAAERLVTAGRHARTLDLLAALSTGLDLADGHVEGHAQWTAYLASRLAASFGLSSDDRSALLYAALLKDAGESAEAAFRSPDTVRRDPLRSRPSQTQPVLARRAARGVEVARQLGLPESVCIAIHSLRERFDGRGGPEGLSHESIPVVGRILAVAEAAEMGLRAGGARGAERVLRSHRGSRYDPALVDLMLSMGKLGLWRELPTDGSAPSLRGMEPVHLIRMSDHHGLDVVAATFADLVDSRTPRQGRHAARVGILAARTATRLGLPEDVVMDLRRAGLLHDVGKLGVPAGVFEKPSELSSVERDAVAAHPAISAAILERCETLVPLADLVRHHHERMDEPGQFPDLETPLRSIAARILALADRFAGMTAERPYRPALTATQAIEILEATTSDRLAMQALRALKSVV